MKLRYYQQEALDKTISYLCEKSGNPLICLATGAGKSIIIASLVEYCRQHWEARICIATHNSDLVKQNFDELMHIMPFAPAGIYSAGLGKKQSNAPVLFAGIQSAYKAPEKIGKVDLLIIDECHTLSRNSMSMWGQFIGSLKQMNPMMRVVGLSATPYRLDSGDLTKGDDALFTDVVYDYGILEGVKDGYLAEIVPKSMATKIDLSKVAKRGGEFIESEQQKAIDVDHITIAAVKELIEYGVNRKTWMVFCTGVDHCHHVAAEIRKSGFTCAVVTGETPQDERESIYAALKRHEIRAVCSVAVMTTGTNIPCIDLIAGLRGTESGGLLVQMLGRGTRPIYAPNMPLDTPDNRKKSMKAGSKPNCVYLDYTGNLARHGPIDLIKGKDKREGDGIPPMRLCPVCSTISHISKKECPDCGFVFPVEEKEDKIEAKAANLAVLSNQRIITRHEVTGALAKEHKGRNGKPDTLRVDYYNGFIVIASEWICINHPSENYGYKQAVKWWKAVTGEDSGDKFLYSTQMAAGIYNKEAKIPQWIETTPDGKFTKITRYGPLVARQVVKSNHQVTQLEEWSDDIAF